jgi:hypothetical protein
MERRVGYERRLESGLAADGARLLTGGGRQGERPVHPSFNG